MKPKSPVQLVTYVWGHSYLREVLDITLAAVVAPGNLPALAAHFKCRFTLCTEARFFKEVEESAAFAAIRKLCPAELCAVDDLVANKLGYGHSLTHILYRAVHSAKQSPQETTFLFFNADWIFGAHCFEALIEPLQRGDRLIVAPSYCAISELAKPAILAAKDPATGILSVEHRDLAELIIRYRHNTIRGKTLDQNELHMDVNDQFYHLVDEHTILGRQMPIAIVCMRPEIVPDRPRTFWDYGTVSEMCPTIRPVVLADSDEFLMMELRSAATYKQNLRFGPRDPDETIRVLSGFTTKDHRDYGRHTLVLHSRDLPVSLPEEQRRFDAYVDGVLDALGPPVAHLDHQYWSELEPIYEMIRDAYRAASQPNAGAPFMVPTMEDAFNAALASFREQLARRRAAIHESRSSDMVGDTKSNTRTELVERTAEFAHVLNVFKALSAARMSQFEAEVSSLALAAADIEREVQAPVPDAPGELQATKGGEPNDLCGWYFDPRLLQPLFISLAELDAKARVLTATTNLSSPLPRLMAQMPGQHDTISLSRIQTEAGSAASEAYDVIVCQPDIVDLQQLPGVLPKLRQILAPGGNIFLCIVDFREGLQKLVTPQNALPDFCEIKLTAVTSSILTKERWWRQVRRLRRFPLGQFVERLVYKMVYRYRRFEYKTAEGIPPNCTAIILHAVPLQ